MQKEQYIEEVRLLVRLLPIVSTEPVFALKGGTAINLFYRDVPRLSVDIDLTYLPLKGRAEALAEIDASLGRIMRAVNVISGLCAKRMMGGGNVATRLHASSGHISLSHWAWRKVV